MGSIELEMTGQGYLNQFITGISLPGGNVSDVNDSCSMRYDCVLPFSGRIITTVELVAQGFISSQGS
jgi:hypothetical protein